MKFSIITPVYNIAPYIAECIESVLAQTHPDWELICIDDGSTDGSSEILDRYAARDSRIKIVHRTNGGVGAARNCGLEMASGEWLGFVDGDDKVAPVWLESAAKVISDVADVDIVTFGQSIFNAAGTVSTCPAWDKCMTGFFQSVYRRSKLGTIRFPRRSIGEDRVYTFRCLAKARKVVLRPEIMYLYRLRPDSAMRSRQTFQKRWDAFVCSLLNVMLLPRLRAIEGVWKRRLIFKACSNFCAMFNFGWGGNKT